MADPIEFSTDDDGAVHIDKMNQFAVQVAGALDGIDAINQAVTDAQTAESNADGFATAANNRANDAEGFADAAANSAAHADYQVSTIDYKTDLQRAQTAIARYGADQPHPGMDNQFQGAWMLDPRLTFSRPGAGWVMGPAGILVERGIDEPRFAYDPLTGAARGLLIEPQNTNIIPDNTSYAGWQTGLLGGVSLMDDPIVGRFARFTTGASGLQVPLFAPSVTALYPITYGQAYFRAGSHRYAVIGGSGTASRYATFDLLAGEVIGVGGGITGARMEPAGGGWWLCSAYRAESESGANSESPGGRYGFGRSDGGAANAGSSIAAGQTLDIAWPAARNVYVSQPMLPIPTAGAAVTRPADVLSCDMQGVAGFSPTRGAMRVEWTDIAAIGTPLMLAANLASPETGDYIAITRDAGRLRISMRVNGVTEHSDTDPADAVVVGAPIRAGLRYASGAVALSVNGNAVRTFAHSEGAPAGLRYLHIGRNAHGIYRRSPWYSFPLADAELRAPIPD